MKLIDWARGVAYFIIFITIIFITGLLFAVYPAIFLIGFATIGCIISIYCFAKICEEKRENGRYD